MIGRRTIATVIVLAPLAAASPARAQMSNEEMLRRIAENNNALHRYSWTTRVEITEKGQKTVGLYKMRYDIDDKLQVTPMSSDAPAPESIEPGIQRLAKLASAYSQPGVHQFSRFLSTAQIWEGRGNTAGTTRIEGTGLQVAGDKVSISLRQNKPERMEVDTNADGQPFHLTVEFRALPQDGPIYAARTTVNVPANQLDIRIENFDYITSAGGAVTTLTLAPGSEVVVRSTQPLSTKVNKTGDVFGAIVDRDVIVDGRTIIARGARAVGRVMSASAAGKSAGGKISIVLTSVDAANGPLPVQTEAITVEAKSEAGHDAGRVIGGSAIGAIIGGIAGGGKGAAIGAAVGGGGGAAVAAGTKGNEVQFEAEQEFVFRLAVPVSVGAR